MDLQTSEQCCWNGNRSAKRFDMSGSKSKAKYLYMLKLCSLTQFTDIPDMLYVLTIINTELSSYVSNTPLRALQAFRLIYPIPTA